MANIRLPKDMLIELLIKSTPENIIKWCGVNKEINKLCKDDTLWEQAYKKASNNNNAVKPQSVTWMIKYFNDFKRARPYGVYKNRQYIGTVYLMSKQTVDDVIKQVAILLRSLNILPSMRLMRNLTKSIKLKAIFNNTNIKDVELIDFKTSVINVRITSSKLDENMYGLPVKFNEVSCIVVY